MYDYKTIGKNENYPSRNLDLLHPYVKSLILKFLDECKKSELLKDCKINITQTLRSIEYQNSLYAISRTVPGKKVTDAKGGSSMHNYGVAVDFAVIKNGKYLPGKTKEEQAYYRECGNIAIKLGFFWGGNFKNIFDQGHIQYTGKYDNNTALALLKQGKSVDEVIGVKS